MRSTLIITVLLTVTAIAQCRRVVKKDEKFVIVVKGNDENNNTTSEVKSANTTRLENISLDYKHDFKRVNKTGDDPKKMYKFEAKDGRVYRRQKSVTEEVLQEPSYSNHHDVLSLPPSEEKVIEPKEPEDIYVYQPSPYKAFKLCPISLEPASNSDHDTLHYAPRPYLYEDRPPTGYRVPKKFVVRYRPIIEMVDDTGADLGHTSYLEEAPTGNGFVVVYPNGMAKMVEPVTHGADNYLESKPTGFISGGAYFHDGLKEYEFQAKPAQDPLTYMNAPSYGTPGNTPYDSAGTSYSQNSYKHHTPSQYVDSYNPEYSPMTTSAPWQQENKYLTELDPTAAADYDYNTGEVGNDQHLSPSEALVSAGTLDYAPSVQNVYGNANVAGYSGNNNQYYSNNQNNYKQYDYGTVGNRNHLYTNGQNGGTAMSYYNDGNVNSQNVLYNQNLKTTAHTVQSNAAQVVQNRKYNP